MGGRGARGAGGGNINAMWRQVFQPIGAPGAPPPNVQPGQPVPAITMQQLQAMDDAQFVDYLNGLKSTPIDPNTYYNNNWDTQRLIANMPELNKAPQVVDAQTFASLPGETLYRTVNSSGSTSAVDICGRTMASDVTTIGGGRMGDGFYFSPDKRISQSVYGTSKNNINNTATMLCKLNSTARVISEDRIKSMVAHEKPAVRNAIMAMGGHGWSGSGYMAYALRKGYNVVRTSSIVNVIDRNAATWSGEIVPYT